MFHNTHSIFADIIQAEIFEPDLSNLIPNLCTTLHTSMHFQRFQHSSEPSVHALCAILQPCLQLLHSIALTLIVSNCLPSSCCTMIQDIASLVPSKYLSSFFVRPWLCFLKYLSTLCHVCMFPHSEYRTRPVFVLFYSTLPIKLILSGASMHLRTIQTLNLCLSRLLTHTQNCSSTHSPFWHILETQFITSVQNTLDATEGRCSARAEANSRKPPHFWFFWPSEVKSCAKVGDMQIWLP